MRRPHVYERSAPRLARGSYQEPQREAAAVAREIAEAVPTLVEKAEAAGLPSLARLLATAGRAAENVARMPDEDTPAI